MGVAVASGKGHSACLRWWGPRRLFGNVQPMGSVTVVPASPSRVSDLLAGGMREANAYNEVFASDGSTREPYRTLLSVLDEGGQAELQPLRASVRRRINEQEVTFNILGVPEGTERPWLLDPLPVVIAEQEWASLAEGLAQRARLLSLIHEDLYGEQRLLRARVIPPELVLAHPEYARACVGWTPLGGQHIRLYASDLARSKDGSFRVYSDRTAAPAGSGYSLENRLVLGRTLSRAFNACHIERVRQFFDSVRESVREVAPLGITEPRTVLL